jgi:hypothetical protein
MDTSRKLCIICRLKQSALNRKNTAIVTCVQYSNRDWICTLINYLQFIQRHWETQRYFNYMLQYLCVFVYLIHMYMCLFRYKIRGTECATHLSGQPYCPQPNYPQPPLEGSCGPKILTISTKLHQKPVTVQAITKQLKKKKRNIPISICTWHVGSRWYTPDLKGHYSCLTICSTVATRLVSWARRNWCQKSNQKARACFTSRCCKSLPARYGTS